MSTYPEFLVRIDCITYNHAPYIEDAMNGFCMQQTTFPFVATIIDDASTDGEPEVIRRYLDVHFDLSEKGLSRQWETDDAFFIYAQHKENKNCYFAVVLLKYNFHSINKSKEPLIKDWTNTKYVALCEGDDYWTGYRKLQMQNDFLESHLDCTMCVHNADRYSMKKGCLVSAFNRSETNRFFSPEECILGGGDWFPTCSMFFRKEIYDKGKEIISKQYVGDYTLQIYMSLVGKVFYFVEKMSVYRVDITNSWVDRYYSIADFSVLKKLHMKEMQIYDEFDKYSNYIYHHAFEERRYIFLSSEYLRFGKYSQARTFLNRIPQNKAKEILGMANIKSGSIKAYFYLYGCSKIYDMLYYYSIFLPLYEIKKIKQYIVGRIRFNFSK